MTRDAMQFFFKVEVEPVEYFPAPAYTESLEWTLLQIELFS